MAAIRDIEQVGIVRRLGMFFRITWRMDEVMLTLCFKY